jgi:hypothetical protein
VLCAINKDVGFNESSDVKEHDYNTEIIWEGKDKWNIVERIELTSERQNACQVKCYGVDLC